MSFSPQIQNYFLKYQVDDEDQLFKIIYQKQFLKADFPKVEQLDLKQAFNEDQMEQDYIKYKQDTYFCFISSAALTIPTGLGIILSNYLNKNLVSETLKLQRSAKIIIGLGLPSFTLFNYGVYRRFFKQYDPEILLRKKYAFYLDKKETRKNY